MDDERSAFDFDHPLQRVLAVVLVAICAAVVLGWPA